MLSRVADHLYWMSRYLERAEHAARLLDVHQNMMLEHAPALEGERSRRLLKALDIRGEVPQVFLLQLLAMDPLNPSSLYSCVAAGRENARQVRDLISSEMWQQVNRLYLEIRRITADPTWVAEPHTLFQTAKEGAQLFQGVTDGTMNHGQGWHFIQLGRHLERAASMAGLLDTFFHGPDNLLQRSDAYLEWVGLLKSATAFESYCKVHSPDLQATAIADFLLLNREFPHSIRFSVERVRHALRAIGEGSPGVDHSRLDRLAGRLTSHLRYVSIEEIVQEDLHRFLLSVRQQLDEVHARVYQAYISYPIESALRRGRTA